MKIYELIKNWIYSNGVEGILGLIIGIALFIYGYQFWSGIALGIFVSKNWDIIKEWSIETFTKENWTKFKSWVVSFFKK